MHSPTNQPTLKTVKTKQTDLALPSAHTQQTKPGPLARLFTLHFPSPPSSPYLTCVFSFSFLFFSPSPLSLPLSLHPFFFHAPRPLSSPLPTHPQPRVTTTTLQAHCCTLFFRNLPFRTRRSTRRLNYQARHCHRTCATAAVFICPHFTLNHFSAECASSSPLIHITRCSLSLSLSSSFSSQHPAFLLCTLPHARVYPPLFVSFDFTASKLHARPRASRLFAAAFAPHTLSLYRNAFSLFAVPLSRNAPFCNRFSTQPHTLLLRRLQPPHPPAPAPAHRLPFSKGCRGVAFRMDSRSPWLHHLSAEYKNKKQIL